MCGVAVQNKCINVEDLFKLVFFHSVMWWEVFDNKAWGGGGGEVNAVGCLVCNFLL
jgi:hypothetical protein